MENNTCTYTYSAKQQEEIAKIRERYLDKEENKMEKLRRLDRSTVQVGNIAAAIVGTISTLVLGYGMCHFLIWSDYSVVGLLASCIGLTGVLATYPLYKCITAKYRKKIAPQILALSEELMN